MNIQEVFVIKKIFIFLIVLTINIKFLYSNWKDDAERRINKYRKAPLVIRVVDKNGKPIKNAKVSVKLIKHAFKFGGIVDVFGFFDEKNASSKKRIKISPEKYKKLFLKFFNSAGFANALKYKLKRNRAKYAEEVINWFHQNGISVRGHTLIWPGEKHLASNIKKALDKPKLLKKLVTKSIIEYAKKWDVMEWDVLNEPRANHLLQDIFGDEIMVEWFKLARENAYNEDCKLYINENKIISDNRDGFMDEYYNTIKYLIDNGAPIDGIGFQTRFGPYIQPEVLYERLEKFAQLGLLMEATEFEIRGKKRKKGPFYDDDMRAKMTEEVMTVYFSHPSIVGIYAWTFVSDEPWALVDENGKIKKNGEVWLNLVNNKWTTKADGITNKNGEFKIRGFLGKYYIRVKFKGKQKKGKIKLEKKGKIVKVRFR